MALILAMQFTSLEILLNETFRQQPTVETFGLVTFLG